MNSRERVHRSIEFNRPDRVPRDLWTLPIAEIQNGAEAVAALRRRWPGDFGSPEVPNPALEATRSGSPYSIGQYRDEWGCVWDNIQAGVVGEVKEPLIKEWEDLDKLRLPVEALEFNRDAVKRYCKANDRFLISDFGFCRIFERLQFLRGSENLYMDLAEEPPELLVLRDRIHAFNCDFLEAWAKTDIDAISIMDDWGSQVSLLISPALWRRFFKPCYAEYCRIAREHGKKAVMHSDGHILDIYDDLIEIGVNAINSQIFCMDIAELGRRFGGRITFWGEVDRQHLLPFGTPDEVHAAVGRVIEELYRPEGGVIAQLELGAAAKIENADAAYAAWAAAPAIKDARTRVRSRQTP